MNGKEFNHKQTMNMKSLLLEPCPETTEEKDIFNLKYLRYSIRAYSWEYRMGFIASLDRAINKLEKEKENESTSNVNG